jgi:hypothetical protein
VEAIVVPGEGQLATQIARECGTAAELPWRLEPPLASIAFPRGMSEADRIIASPLVGLLAEESLARRTFDFAHPRKAPDFAALKRQRVLLGALAAILVLGGGYVAALLRLDSMNGRLENARTHANSLQAEYVAMLASDARLNHIEQWRSARADWIGHLAYLSEQMPDPRQALMDQYSGQLGAAVEFSPKDGRYDPNGWGVRQNARISIQGQIKQGGIAGTLRERLIDSGVYSRVDSKGPDTTNLFSLELQSAVIDPASPRQAGREGPAQKEVSR